MTNKSKDQVVCEQENEPVLKTDQTEADNVGDIEVGGPFTVGDAPKDAALVLQLLKTVELIAVQNFQRLLRTHCHF